MRTRYWLGNYLGRGTYGVVAKALDFNKGNTVAIKVSLCIDVTFEESEILRLLSPSPYVVQILGRGKAEVVQGRFLKLTSTLNNGDDSGVAHANEIAYIAMELMDTDLLSFIKKTIHGGPLIYHYYDEHNWLYLRNINRAGLVKGLMWELCRGVAYCHNMGVAHRDLKPDNCLLSINTAGGIRIKLADFGLAKMVKDKKNGVIERNGKEYVSLWYRAPELLLQQKAYNCFAVDIWALGCIFAEMVIGEPLFCGQSAEEQLSIVFQHVGGSAWEMMDKYWDALSDLNYNEICVQLLSSILGCGGWRSGLQNRLRITAVKMGCSIGMDLLLKMLEVDPTKRLTAKQCLQHPYFSCFHAWSATPM